MEESKLGPKITLKIPGSYYENMHREENSSRYSRVSMRSRQAQVAGGILTDTMLMSRINTNKQ